MPRDCGNGFAWTGAQMFAISRNQKMVERGEHSGMGFPFGFLAGYLCGIACPLRVARALAELESRRSTEA
jgi:hypothetical protein